MEARRWMSLLMPLILLVQPPLTHAPNPDLLVQTGSCAAGGCGVDGGVMWQNHPMGMPGSPGLDSSIPQAWQQVEDSFAAEREPPVNTDGKKVKKKKARPTVGAPAPSVPPLDLLRTTHESGELRTTAAPDAPVAMVVPATGATLSIAPAFLDWARQALCEPVELSVSVTNTARDQDLLVLSVSTDSVQFYPTRFQPATVVPGHSQTLTVAFLPRTLGEAMATLLLHTSHGGFLLQLRGEGVRSQYGLTPVRGAKVLNVAWLHQLTLYNPHSVPLQVKDVVSTDEFLQLHMPPPPGGSRDMTHDAGAALRFLPVDTGEHVTVAQARETMMATASESHPWLILPGESATVALVEFAPHALGKYLGSVQLRAVAAERTVDVVVPFELLSHVGGVYAVPEEIDFGGLHVRNQQTSRPLRLVNSGHRPIAVMDIHPTSIDTCITIQFQRGITLLPQQELTVATVTYQAKYEGRHVAKLLLRTNDTDLGSSRTEVSVRAHVMLGALAHDKHAVNFRHAGPTAKHTDRALLLINRFQVPLVLYRAEVLHPAFTVEEFTVGQTVAPNASLSTTVVRFHPNRTTDDMFSTELVLATNGSSVRVPLHVYHGKLHYQQFSSFLHLQPPLTVTVDADGHLLAPAPPPLAEDEEDEEGGTLTLGLDMEERWSPAPIYIGEKDGDGWDGTVGDGDDGSGVTELNFGVVGVGEAREVSFNLTNANPVPVDINVAKSSLAAITLTLASLANSTGEVLPLPPSPLVPLPANATNAAQSAHKKAWMAQGWGRGVLLRLEAGQSATLTATLLSSEEESAEGLLTLGTVTESLNILTSYASLTGTLQVSPSAVRFEPAFPGMVRRKPLWAWSTYARPLTILAVLSSDPRLIPQLSNVTLAPNTRMHIGFLTLDTARVALEENYLSDGTFAGLSGLSTPAGKLTRLDVQALKRRELVWNAVEARGLTHIRASLTLHTDVARGVPLTAHGTLERPSLLVEPLLNFSLVQVGVETAMHVLLKNPCDHPVAVRLLPLPLLASQEEFNAAHDALAGGDHRDDEHDLLAMPRLLREASPAFKLHGDAALQYILPAHSETVVGPVLFTPTSAAVHTGVLLIKNNLTLLQALPLVGEGGTGAVQFETAQGSALKSLTFTLTAHTLGLTDDAGRRGVGPGAGSKAKKKKRKAAAHTTLEVLSHPSHWPPTVQLTVRAVNRGNLPVHVLRASLGSELGGCDTENGLFIMDCAGQMDRVLEPGESFKLSVTFTPDFYLSRLSEPLLLITSTGITQFPLEVTLPHHLLAACHERSPRSQWEQQCHSVTVAILSVGLLALLLLTLRDMAADLRLDLAARTAAAAAAAVVSPARTSLKKEPLPTTPTKPSPAPPDCIPEKDEPRLKISAAPASAAVDPSRVRRPSEVAATEKAKKQKKKKAPTVDVASPPAALPPHAPDSPSATASQQHRTATASTASISSAMEAEILSPQPRDVPMPSFAPRASSAPSFPPTESTPPPSPQKRVEPKKSPPAAPTTIRSARSPPPPSPKKELKAAAIPVLPTRPTLPQLPDSLSPAPSLKPSSTAFHPYANPNPEPPSNPFSNPATFSLLSTPQFGAPQRSSFQPATASASLSSAGGLFASDPWAAPPLSLPHHHQSASPSLPSDLYAATFNSPIHHQHSSKPTLPPGMPRVPLGHQRHQRQSSDTLDLLLPGGLPTFSPLEPVEPPPSDLERRRRLLAHGSATFPPAAAPLSSVQGLQQSRLGGMRDSLSSIGLARLGAESELGNRVYSIWGDDSAAALPSFHLQPPRAEPAARNGNGGSSFFNFPLSMDEMDDSLEPDSGAANEPAAAAGAFNSPSGGMFSMFSLPQDAHATSHTFFGNDAKWT